MPETSHVPLLVVISAPSGGGKTTLCNQLLDARHDMTRAVTCTTREPRDGEVDGVDYYFLDAASFLKRVQAGHFLEHATVYGNSYGTLKSEVLGKLRGTIEMAPGAAEADVLAAAEAEPNVAKALEGKRVVKRIHVPNRIVNFVVAG